MLREELVGADDMIFNLEKAHRIDIAPRDSLVLSSAGDSELVKGLKLDLKIRK